MITISIKGDHVIRIRNEKREEKKTSAAKSLVPNDSLNLHFTCSVCLSTFSDSEDYSRHRLGEIETVKNRQKQPYKTAEMKFTREKDIPPNPIWWLEAESSSSS